MTEFMGASVQHFNSEVQTYFAHKKAELSDISTLVESMEYSLLGGGKRFRPLLCYAMAECFDLKLEKVTPFAMAVECVHTYSLIHDDLPCMDDDSERRGQPTNHIKFGEEVALLAGDSLLTEAFQIIAKNYSQHCSELIKILAQGSGMDGMVRGQVLDLGKGKATNSLTDLIHLHHLKTGQLISMCLEGPALLAGRPRGPVKELGLMMGLAFQVKDDLLDIEDNDLVSFVAFLGKEGAEQYLSSLTEKIFTQLKELSLESSNMRELIEFNLNREL